MATTTVLQDTLRHTHDELAGRLDHARTIIARPEQTRRGCPPIDRFLAGASRHLHAVDEVLLPVVGHECADGATLIHAYQPAARHLEVLLFHVKAHEYGSTWETSHEWPTLWGEVEDALGAQEEKEDGLAEHLAAVATEDLLREIAERFPAAEAHSPTRPHPFLPHTGPFGSVARWAARYVDGAWDALEGRDVGGPPPKPRPKPGLIGQYLLGDPRFEPAPDPDQETGENAAGER
ncbi:MAG: hypothetical protein J2O46_07935 [Nocardioides sp.]|nr:hypothetical protein [Nocardioides sp.]